MDDDVADLTLTMLEHRAMRVDASRLARHLREVAPAGALRHSYDAARWYRRFRSTIHDHHRFESELLFPALTERVPEFAEVDSALEGEHETLEDRLRSAGEAHLALVDAAGSSTWQRARTEAISEMDGLVEIVNRHLDHEEATAFPVLREALPADAYKRLMTKGTRLIGVGAVAFTAPWVLEKAGDDEAADVLTVLPRPLRWLYNHRWAPSYRRLVIDAGLPSALVARGAATSS
jgi:hemerythrin-like domain-containing protein